MNKEGLGVHDKEYQKESLDKLQEANKVPLEKMFNNDEHCRTYWCFKKTALVEGNEYNNKDDKL